MVWENPAVLGGGHAPSKCGSWEGKNRTYLQGDVSLGPDLGGGQFHIGVLAHEIHSDELFTPGSSKAWGTAASGLLLYHDALRPVLALILVTGAGL